MHILADVIYGFLFEVELNDSYFNTVSKSIAKKMCTRFSFSKIFKYM